MIVVLGTDLFLNIPNEGERIGMKKRWIGYLLLFTAGLLCACQAPASDPQATKKEVRPTEGQAYLATEEEYEQFYAQPGQYTGALVYNSYMVQSDRITQDGKQWYEATGWVRSGNVTNFTLLEWEDSAGLPTLKSGDYVFVLGTVEPPLTGTDDQGQEHALAHIKILSIEKSAKEASLYTADMAAVFDALAQTQGTLTMSVVDMNFQQDGSTLGLNTQDTSVTDFTTLYCDLILHQDGYVHWYSDCNIILGPGESTSYDLVPFPAFDSSRPLTLEVHIKGEDGKRLYAPLFFDIDPS